MKNFIFKSSDLSDLQKIIQLLVIKLDIQGKNTLYLTHEVDKILKIVKSLDDNMHLQKQVDEYFDETSHQTDSTEHGN